MEAVLSPGKASVYQFNTNVNDWVQIGQSVAASNDNACTANHTSKRLPSPHEERLSMNTNPMRLAMSSNSEQIAVSCPISNEKKGRVSIYNIQE